MFTQPIRTFTSLQVVPGFSYFFEKKFQSCSNRNFKPEFRVKQNFLSITNDGFVIHSSETKQFQQIHNQELKAVENKAIYINLGFVWHGVFHDVVIYNFPIMWYEYNEKLP